MSPSGALALARQKEKKEKKQTSEKHRCVSNGVRFSKRKLDAAKDRSTCGSLHEGTSVTPRGRSNHDRGAEEVRSDAQGALHLHHLDVKNCSKTCSASSNP